MSLKKPTELKIFEGNPGHRPIDENEVKPKKVFPRPPTWLSKEAKKEWRKMGKILYSYNLLTELDITAFTNYCIYYGMHMEILKEISSMEDMTGTTEKGYQYILPNIILADKFEKITRFYLSKFGMTPSDRVGLSVDMDANKELTEFEKTLSGLEEVKK